MGRNRDGFIEFGVPWLRALLLVLPDHHLISPKASAYSQQITEGNRNIAGDSSVGEGPGGALRQQRARPSRQSPFIISSRIKNISVYEQLSPSLSFQCRPRCH